MDKAQLVKKFISFINGIKKTDRVAILYHPDGDGVCAAAITIKVLAKLNRKPKLVFTQKAWQISLTPASIKKMRQARINKLIILDMAADQCPGCVTESEKRARLLIIDHHILSEDVNSKRTILIKPQFVSDLPGDKYPTAKLCYDLFSQFAKKKKIDISDLDWLAAVGLIADKSVSEWKEFLRATANKYMVNVRRFFEAEELIDCARCAGKIATAFKIIYNAETLGGVIDSKLVQYKKVVLREIEHHIKNRKRLAEFYPDAELVWYVIFPKHSIKAKLANDLSIEYYPHQTVMVITKDARADVSARRQDKKISMHELLRSALEGIPRAAGGGHAPAAACILPTKNLEQFKENVLRLSKEMLEEKGSHA